MSYFLLSLPLWGEAVYGKAGYQMVASLLPACLPACCPEPGTVPVPRIDFKLVNNFPFGLVDVIKAREVLPQPTLASLPHLFSFHDVPSPGGLPFLPFLRDLCCSALMSHLVV